MLTNDELPDDIGNEDEEWLSLVERAAVNAGTRVCRCSHLESEHRKGECDRLLHPACGCIEFRPVANTYSTASHAGDFPAAGRRAS